MKAAVFKNLGQPLQIEKVPDPTPEATELVVKVAYCGICGTDLHSTREGAFAAECDSILGHEFWPGCRGRLGNQRSVASWGQSNCIAFYWLRPLRFLRHWPTIRVRGGKIDGD